MAYQYLNLDYLELMSGGDKTDRRRLLEMLEKDLRESPRLMQLTLKDQDWGKLERQAHYFKSTLPFTGCEKLIATHQTFYQLVRSRGEQPEVALLLGEVRESCQAVLKEVRQELEKG
jgi:HPt (histidine-containing phosphotransfer) domain-containing protein